MRQPIIVLLVLACFVLVSCGKGEETPERSAYSELTDMPGAENPEPNFQPNETYRSNHDPDAVYTMDNITLEGSYLKVDFRDLTPDQFNRVIHRAKAEKSTCGSGLTIDECLVNRPNCGTALTLIKQIVREETMKG